jgi:hypothetical protein
MRPSGDRWLAHALIEAALRAMRCDFFHGISMWRVIA